MPGIAISHKGRTGFGFTQDILDAVITQAIHCIVKDFNIEAKNLGILKFDIELKTIDGEYTDLNNAQSIYVEVLNGRQHILFLAIKDQ